MKKLLLLIIVLTLSVTLNAADTKTTGLTELTTVADIDLMHIVDDPGGTSTSKKITVLNLFDTIDTEAEFEAICAALNFLIETEIDASSELLALMDDETGTGVLVFGTAPTFTTGITITGANHNPAAAGEIRYDTTIAELSGGVLRWYDDNSIRMLVDLETDVVDGDDDKVVAYDSAADGFYMKADADTGGNTVYNLIADATGAGSIGFGDNETATYATVQDSAASFFSLINSNADVSNQVYMLDLDYSVDTTQDNADFIRLQDAGSTLIVFEEEGKVTMTPSGVDDATIISIIPSTALTQADVAWYGIKIDGAALDPGAVDNRILGVAVDLSGVDLTNDPYVRALDLKMPTGGVALDIEEGEIHQDFTTGSDAGAEYTAIDVVIHAETLNAASTIHAIDIALSAGDPAGDVYALGTHSFIGPVKQSIGVYTTQDNLELQGRKTGGGAAWVDDVDGQECFVANADEVYLGDDAATGAQFNEIQVIMGTPGTRSVNPTFWYNTAADLWTEFFPADDTLGFQQSGLIRWTLGDISGLWTNNGDPGVGESTAGWWIKIIRNEAPDPGTPTPTTAKTGVITDCTWSKTGALNVVSVEAGTITEGGNAVWNASETDIIDSAHYIAASIDNEHLADNAVDSAEINTNAVKLDALDVSDVSDNIAGDIAEGELADAIIVDADIKDDTIQEAALDCTAGPTDNYILSYDSGTTGFTWVVDATGGTTAYNDIGDAAASGSISFDAAEAGVYTSATTDWVGLTISNTAANLTGDSELLTLAFTDDGDTNSHYLIMSDAAGTQQLEVIQSTADIQITTAGDLKFVAGGGDFDFANDNINTTGTLNVNAIDSTGSFTGRSSSDTAATDYGITFQKARDGAPTLTVSENDYLGEIIFQGWGDAYSSAAIIRAIVDNTTGAGDMPGRLEFLTSADASESPTLRLTIDSVGLATFNAAANVIGTLTVGTAATVAGNLSLYDAGTLTIYEDGDNFNVTLACNSGEAVATLTGGLDITGVLTTSSLVSGSTTGDGTIVIHDDDVGGDATVTIQAVDATGTNYTLTLPPDDGANTEVLQTDGSGVLTWVANAGGNTAYDDIGDPDAASSISFADGETVTWATAEDSAGSFFTIDNSDAALAANTYLIHLLYSVDDDEANADYFKCEDAGGVVFTIQEYGDFGGTGDMLLDSGAADSPIIKLVNANDDEFKMQLETASNIAFQIFGDTGDKFHFHLEDRGAGTGANNDITGFVVKMETETNNTLEEVSEIRTNLTDATATTTDATMEFYTAVGSSLTKSITLTGADVAVAGALTLGSDIVGEPKHFRFNLFDPLAVQTLDTQVCIVPLTSAALTITNIKITLDAAGNEVAGDLKYADTFIGLANPVVINICDTSSGVLNDSAMGTAAVPATKCVYFQFDSAPHTDITQMIWDITYDYD